MTRRLARLATAILLAATALLAGAAGAWADAPNPENPLSGGPASSALPVPNPPPPVGDPFEPEGNTSILEQYGTSGMAYQTYDTGAPWTSASPNMSAWVGNRISQAAQWGIAQTAALADFVLAPHAWLDKLTGPVDQASNELAGALGPVLVIVVVAAALMMAFAAWKGRTGPAMTGLAFVVVAAALFAVAQSAPTKLVNLGVDTTTYVARSVLVADGSAANPGTKIMAPYWHRLVYLPWLEGHFGASDSATARAYGPDLFKAGALRWDEALKLEAMPQGTDVERRAKAAAVENLNRTKREEFDTVAGKVKATDPTAYRYLQGFEGDSSNGSAFMSLAGTFFCLAFLVVALLMLMVGFLTFLLLAALLPVIALGMALQGPSLGRRVGGIVLAVFVNTAVYAVAAVVVLKLTTTILGLGLNRAIALVLCGVVSAMLWGVCKPHRQVSHVVGKMGVNQGTAEARRRANNMIVKPGKKALKKSSKGAGKQAKAKALGWLANTPKPDGARHKEPARTGAAPAGPADQLSSPPRPSTPNARDRHGPTAPPAPATPPAALVDTPDAPQTVRTPGDRTRPPDVPPRARPVPDSLRNPYDPRTRPQTPGDVPAEGVL